MLYLYKKIKEQEKILVENMFLEQDYKKCLGNSVEVFKEVLGAEFFSQVHYEVEALAQEFTLIDSM